MGERDPQPGIWDEMRSAVHVLAGVLRLMSDRTVALAAAALLWSTVCPTAAAAAVHEQPTRTDRDSLLLLYLCRCSSCALAMSLRGSFQPKKVAPSSRAKGAAALTQAGGAKTLTKAALIGPALTVRRAEITDAEAVQLLYQEQSLLQRENIIRSYGSHRIQTLMSVHKTREHSSGCIVLACMLMRICAASILVLSQ